MSAVRLALLARVGAIAVATATAACVTADAAAREDPAKASVETVRVELAVGSADVDVYWPESRGPAPLVLVAHGFWRDRGNMSGWGRRLAAEGFVAAVPDLPAWSDHARNGRFLTELRAHLCARFGPRIDPSRVGLVGFSAGGLSSLLSAVEAPHPAIWVGLDPVDRKGLGAKAASRLACRAVVLTAEPSACNAQGNTRDLLAALPRGEHAHVAGAVHTDAEWPTTRMAEAVCGRSTGEKRDEFRRRAIAALRETLLPRPAPDTAPR